MQEEQIKQVLEEFLKELQGIIDELGLNDNEIIVEAFKPDINFKTFFNEVRHSLFGGRLKKSQVEGMETKLIVFKKEGISLSNAAYLMATSYHETAKRMQPVKEGLNASDAWRRRNLRYYPWYGRGDVQLTWKYNYERVDKELGLDGALVENADLALDTEISARALVAGVMGGWYNGRGHGLAHYVPNNIGTLEEFKQARRTVNIMDKATMIARQALKFQDALVKAGY